jgi:hypothetical protein
MKNIQRINSILLLVIMGNSNSSGQSIHTSANKGNFFGTYFVTPIICQNCVFTQNIDLGHAHFYDSADFLNARFDQEANFDSTIFTKGVSFESTHFKGSTNFSRAKFYKPVNFKDAKFDSTTALGFTEFYDTANFKNSTFSSGAIITGTEFCKTASFDESNFNTKTIILLSAFDKGADFDYAKFHNEATFFLTTFTDLASFYMSEFDGPVDFSSTEFKGKVIFRKMRIGNLANFEFNGTVFPDSIDFSYIHIPNYDIDLTHGHLYSSSKMKISDHARRLSILSNIFKQLKTYFVPRLVEQRESGFIYVNLYNTDISKIKIDYKHFRLYFSNEEADTVKFESRILDRDEKASIYESLLKNFKDRGQTESETNLDIEYQYFKGSNSTQVYLRDWWDRFGHEKERIFIHTFLFLFIFTIITFFSLPFLHENIYQFNAINAKYAFWPRLWFSFIYTSIIFFTFSLKIENLKFATGFKYIIGAAYIILIYAVGIICIAYMANFVLQK